MSDVTFPGLLAVYSPSNLVGHMVHSPQLIPAAILNNQKTLAKMAKERAWVQFAGTAVR